MSAEQNTGGVPVVDWLSGLPPLPEIGNFPDDPDISVSPLPKGYPTYKHGFLRGLPLLEWNPVEGKDTVILEKIDGKDRQDILWENAVREWREYARLFRAKSPERHSVIGDISSGLSEENRRREITPSEIVYVVWPLFSRGGYAKLAYKIWEEDFLHTDDPASMVREYLPTQEDFLRVLDRVRRDKFDEYGDKPLRLISLISWYENVLRMASVIYPDNPSRTRR